MITLTSFIAAYFLWDWIHMVTEISNPFVVSWNDLWKILGFSLIWVMILARQHAYSSQRYSALAKEISRIAKTILIGVALIIAAIYLFRIEYVPRAYILTFGAINLSFMTGERIVFYKLVCWLRSKGRNRKHILVIGTAKYAREFIETVKKNISWGLNIIGLISEKDVHSKEEIIGHPILGGLRDLEEVLHSRHIDEVIVCLPSRRFGEIRMALDCCEREGIRVRIFSDIFGTITKSVRIDQVFGIRLISLTHTMDNELDIYIKRLIDILISGILLLLFLPVFIIISISIKVTSRGPVIYHLNWVGKDRKTIKGYKFRTMVNNAEQIQDQLQSNNEMKGPVFKIHNDPRITKVGKFLRKYSIDELPQLWSVFVGDISLVGPRPPLISEVKKYESWHRRRVSVKPGITCLWQVRGRQKISDFDSWAKLDMEYIDNWTLWLDFKILLKTIPVVFRGTGV